jgi:hypothetical protein
MGVSRYRSFLERLFCSVFFIQPVRCRGCERRHYRLWGG